MPLPDTEINLDDLFAAITSQIAAEFPVFQLVESYPEDRRNLPTPACAIELADMEPADDIGTEQLAVTARFEARIVMGFREPNVRRAVPKLAAAVALHIRGKRWGLPVEPAIVTAIEPDDFDPDLDQFEVWRVDWQQIIHIGPSIWDNDGSFPAQVLAGISPDIGPASEGEYQTVIDGSQQ